MSSTSEDYLEGPVLRYGRYSHVTRDIEYILQVPGVARSLLAGGYGKTASVEVYGRHGNLEEERPYPGSSHPISTR